MDPVTLFGIATAATIVGVSFLMSLKWMYSMYKAKRRRSELQPQQEQVAELRIRVPR